MSGSFVRRVRRGFATFGVGVLAVGLIGFTPADEREALPAVGETDLYNLELVDNFSFETTEAELGANDHGAGQQGTDLEFFTTTVDGEERDFAVVGGYTRGAYIFDITDPDTDGAKLARFVPCAQPRNDVGVHQFTDEDGTLRTWIGLSLQSGRVCEEAGEYRGNVSGSGGFALFDVTDPYAEPVGLGAIQVGYGGVHNLVFHPTEPLAYVWNGALPGAVNSVQIVDLADLSHVTVSQLETLGGPHDGELSPDGSLLYMASENNYEIFDNSDPRAPVRVGQYTPNVGTYAHGYFPTPDGDISITNNESLALGGFFASGSGACPGEGLAFYDTSDPALPVGPIGYFAPPVQGRTDDRACTSHFGRVVPNGKVMTVGWYILGARVIDLSDPTQPREIGAATIADTEDPAENGSEAWAAKAYRGPYVYVGDQGRGFDIFRWTGALCPEGHPAAGASPFEDGWTSDCVPEGRATLVDPARTRLATDPRELEVTGVGSPTWRFSCQV